MSRQSSHESRVTRPSNWPRLLRWPAFRLVQASRGRRRFRLGRRAGHPADADGRMVVGHGTTDCTDFPAVDNSQKLATARPLDRLHDKRRARGPAGVPAVRRFTRERVGFYRFATAGRPGSMGTEHGALAATYRRSPGLSSLKRRLGRRVRSPKMPGATSGLVSTVSWPASMGVGFALFTADDGLPPGAIRDIHRDRIGPAVAGVRAKRTRSSRQRRRRAIRRFVSYTTAQGSVEQQHPR